MINIQIHKNININYKKMKKNKCSHLEKEWQQFGQFWQLRYKCKFSRIENGVSAQKRLCKECRLQLEIKFD